MTDETPAPESPQPSESRVSRKIVLGLLGLLVVLLVAGFLISQAGLDKALVRQQLDAFARTLNENGHKEGRDLHFTYDDVAFTGSFSGRHAVVLNPQLSIKPLATPGHVVKPEDELLVRSSSLSIYPKAVNLSSLQLVFDKPLDFYTQADTSKKLLTVQAATPFKVDIAQEKQDNRAYLNVSQTVPASIDFTYLREQQAEGAEEATPTVVPVYETLHLTMQPGGSSVVRIAKDGSGMGESHVALKDITFTPEVQPEGQVKIAAITSDWSHTLSADKHQLIHADMHFGALTAPQELFPYAPVSFDMTADYDGASLQSAEDVAANPGGAQGHFKLSQFSLKTAQSALTAQADFTEGGGEVLPTGMAQVKLTNVPFVLGELQKIGLVNDDNGEMIAEFAQHITGSKLTDLTDADIAIHREKGGQFAIGKSSFEDLFALLLKYSVNKKIGEIKGNAAPAAPQQPARQKIQVEEGARG